MNYLCAVLLLAFAAGSVHSQFCSSPGYYKPEIEKEFQKQWNSHFPITFDNIPLLTTVTLPLVGTISEVTGVSISEVLDVSVVFDGFYLYIELFVNVGCDSFPLVKVMVSIKVELNAYLEQGCPHLDLSPGLSVQLSLSGTALDPNKLLIDAVLKATTAHVMSVVENIFDIVLLTINCFAKSFNRVHIIAGQPCHYELSEVQIEDGLLRGACCLHTGGGPACSENVDIILPDGALLAVGLTNNVLEKMFELAVLGFKFQLQIPEPILGGLVDTYGSPIYFDVRFTGTDASSFTPNGVDVIISLKISIYTLTEQIISTTTTLHMTGAIIHENGYWGVQLKASLSEALVLTVVEDGCGCQASILPWLLDYCTWNLDGITGVLNAHLHLCLPVPLPPGIPYNNLNIAPGEGFCFFHYY